MARTLKRVLLTLAVVFVGGWGYSLLIVPLVEGGPVKERSTFVPSRSGNSLTETEIEKLKPYLPDDAWELQPPKKLQLDHGRVYFEKWTRLEDGRLEVSPFTLVYHEPETEANEPEETRPPIILRAPEGAVLTFDRPFQPGLGMTGKMVGAVLRGEVKIFRKAGKNAGDELEITTRNIQIEPDQIFTPHRVEFRIGAHHGKGQSLRIELLTDRSSSAGKVPKVRGVKSFELVKVDYLSLAVPAKATRRETASDSGPAGNLSAASTHIHVQCSGPFELDMVEQIASFKEDVQVSHREDETQREVDSLDCQQLTIEFIESAGEKPSIADSHSDNPHGTALKVQRLIALGRPAVLHSVERDFHAEAEYLSYDPVAQRIVMRDQDKVLLLHKDLRFEAPAFEYDLEEGKNLGTASAVGAGRIVRIPGTDHSGLDISWQEELQLRPHDGLHALSLYGSPQLRMGREGQFEADELHVWLSETAREKQAESDEPTSSRIEPVKLLAQGHVKIDSPKLGGTTNRLEVFWDHVEQVGPADANSDRASAPTANRAAQNSAVDSRDSEQTQLLGARDNQEPARKLTVGGDFIRARLKPDQKSFSVEEITIEGQARLVETSKSAAVNDDPANAPLAIAGRLLQVNSLGGDLYAAYVVADEDENPTPTLAARGMELFGTQLQLNQAQHRMWMDGVGEARLHSKPNQQETSSLTGPVVVRWRGGLDFDGQLVRIRDSVNIWLQSVNEEGRLSTVQLQGERLDIRLTEKVDLTGGEQLATKSPNGDLDASTKAKAEVETLILGGKVLITHWETLPDGEWQAVDRLTAYGAGVHYQTGNLIAGGPGVAQSIRLGDTFKSLPGKTSDSGKPAEKVNKLTHVRIEFNRAIEGNLFEKQMAFVEQVQVFSAEVPTWESWLERTELQRSSDLVYLRADQLTLDEVLATRDASPTWLIQAVGNAYLTGRGVEANASRMTYDQGKDLLTLVAEGRDDAQLTRQSQPGAAKDHIRAREIKFWRSLNQVEIDGISSLSTNARLGDNGRQDQQPRSGNIR